MWDQCLENVEGVVYSEELIMNVLIERCGMDYWTAREHFDFNILGLVPMGLEITMEPVEGFEEESSTEEESSSSDEGSLENGKKDENQ